MDGRQEYDLNIDEKSIRQKINLISEKEKDSDTIEIRKKIFSLIDLTTLEVSDNGEKITNIVGKINDFTRHYKDFPPVTAICTYPSFLPTVADKMKEKSIKKSHRCGFIPFLPNFF